MKLEIEVNENVLSQAAENACNEMFKNSSYGRQDAIGAALLKRVTEEFVRNMDLTPYIKAAVKANIDDVVNQVVEQALRDAAKKKARQMQKDGTLLDA